MIARLVVCFCRVTMMLGRCSSVTLCCLAMVLSCLVRHVFLLASVVSCCVLHAGGSPLLLQRDKDMNLRGIRRVIDAPISAAVSTGERSANRKARLTGIFNNLECES